jgi:hypothetical protein
MSQLISAAVQRLRDALAAASGGLVVGWLRASVGAVLRSVHAKLQDMPQSVEDFGAVADGVTNNTAAFNAARLATAGRYHLPGPGVYVVDAAALSDVFTAGPGVSIKVGASTYNVSNAVAGLWRVTVESPVLASLRHAVTGNIIAQVQDGGPGTALYLKRGLSIQTDSHFLQAGPATVGGSTDLLLQRSAAHPTDPGGNRFNNTFEEALDRWLFSYATTASGAPAFDSFMAVYAGIAPRLEFPGLKAEFKQGWQVQTRAGGALRYECVPLLATRHTLRDGNSGNVLATVTRSEHRFAGLGFDTLLDVPQGVIGPKRWGAVFGDLAGTDGVFPVTKTFMSAAGATRCALIGTLRVAAQPSGGAGGSREARFVFDGTTVTLTDVVNTLPASFTCTVTAAGSDLRFSGSYTGALGGGYTVVVSIEFEYAGR